jgi:hypothetical protein
MERYLVSPALVGSSRKKRSFASVNHEQDEYTLVGFEKGDSTLVG